MNTQSIDCRKVESGKIEKPGDFSFDDDFTYLYIWLPGMSGPDAIGIQKGEPGGPRIWGWNGDENKPTLKPSINSPGQWHGYLTAGRLLSC